MVEPISDAKKSREIGPAQSRSQASSEHPVADAGERMEALQAAVERLIERNPPRHSRLQILQDENGAVFVCKPSPAGTATTVRRWPPAQLLKLRHYIQQMEALLLDIRA